MGSNLLPNHFQWPGKVLPACEGDLQLEVSAWLPGLEQLQPPTWVLAAFPLEAKWLLCLHTRDVHQAAHLYMEVVPIHMQVSARGHAILAKNLSIHKDFVATKGFPDFFWKK